MAFWRSKKKDQQAEKKLRVAIVDDNADLRATLTDWLELAGFEPLEARSGPAGWTLIQKDRPDLVILDVGMDGLDGYQVCRLARSNANTSTIPIIMLTGMTTMGEVEEAFRAGANDYVQKPFDWWRLHKKICTLLNLPEPPKL